MSENIGTTDFENIRREDFEKLTKDIADLGIMMHDGFQDLQQSTYTRNVERHEPPDPRSTFVRGPPDQT